MCSFKTWYYNEQIGYVVECDDCKNLQIGFGNVVATISIADFETFRNHIICLKENYSDVQNPGQKTILLQTPYTGLQILLNKGELDNLYNMIEYADNERKTTQLLHLFVR